MGFGGVSARSSGVSIRDIDSNWLTNAASAKRKECMWRSTPGGMTEEAGLREGDIITRVGDITVNNTRSCRNKIGRFRPGDRVNLRHSARRQRNNSWP